MKHWHDSLWHGVKVWNNKIIQEIALTWKLFKSHDQFLLVWWWCRWWRYDDGGGGVRPQWPSCFFSVPHQLHGGEVLQKFWNENYEGMKCKEQWFMSLLALTSFGMLSWWQEDQKWMVRFLENNRKCSTSSIMHTIRIIICSDKSNIMSLWIFLILLCWSSSKISVIFF